MVDRALWEIKKVSRWKSFSENYEVQKMCKTPLLTNLRNMGSK